MPGAIRKLYLAAMSLAFIAAACGGSGAPTVTNETTPVPTSTSPAPVPTASAQPTAAPTATAVRQPSGQFRVALAAISGYGLYPGFVSNKVHLDPMFDPLVGLDLTGQPNTASGVVSSWEASTDGLKYTLKVRDGVIFHTGDAATAQDVKHTLDLYMTDDLPLPGRTQPSIRKAFISQINVADDRTVTVTLKLPAVLFIHSFLTLDGVGTSDGYLLSKNYWESKGRDSAIKSPVGSGPYKYKSDINNQEVVEEFAGRPHWYYGIPKYQVVKFNVIPESQTRVALLKSESAESADIPRNVIQEMRSAGYDIVENPGNKVEDLRFHDQFQQTISGYGKNPFADARVRQALSIAIDRDLLNKTFAYGLGQPTIARLASRDFAYKPYPVPKQDLAQAKRLLAEAGFPNGFEILMVQYNPLPGSAEGPQMMEAIAVWWEGLGIKVQRRSADIVPFLAEIAKHAFPKPTVSGGWLVPAQGYTRVMPDGIKTVIARETEDDEVDQATKDLPKARTLAEYTAGVQRIQDLRVSKWIDCPLLSLGEVWTVRKGLGGDKWNMGRGSFGSYNMNSILSGRV